jgi:hypothetical protein
MARRADRLTVAIGALRLGAAWMAIGSFLYASTVSLVITKKPAAMRAARSQSARWCGIAS